MTQWEVDMYLVLDYLSEGQVEIDLTFAEQFKVAAAASWLSLALDPVGKLQLYQARLKAHGPHGGGGGCHLDALQTREDVTHRHKHF